MPSITFSKCPEKQYVGVVKSRIWELEVKFSSIAICVALGKLLSISIPPYSSFTKWRCLHSSHKILVKIN